MSNKYDEIIFREAREGDVRYCFELECDSYPADEAASFKNMKMRQAEASPYFRVCCIGGDGVKKEEIIGFINSTRCVSFEEESMSHHDPEGSLLAIHSVVIRKDKRRNGYATKMLTDYIHHIARNHANLEKLVLIAKQHLLRFYISCGFKCLGLSNIVHGRDPWFDLDLDLQLMIGEKFWVVDSFAENFGGGNPAAVVLVNPELMSHDDTWMQIVAQEFNLSETAFIQMYEKDVYSIRFFSPTCEVDLCGHATLAAAAVIFEKRSNSCIEKSQRLLLKANNHDLAIKRANNTYIMKFPWKDTIDVPLLGAKEILIECLLGGLGITKQNIIYLGIGVDNEDVLVEVKECCFEDVGKSGFDVNELCKPNCYTRGVIVCCRNSSVDYDFKSRFFGPKCGIAEDPVTGSAHCLLAPYFGKLLKKKRLIGHQESSRGGVVECELVENQSEANYVVIKGSALFASSGVLHMK